MSSRTKAVTSSAQGDVRARRPPAQVTSHRQAWGAGALIQGGQAAESFSPSVKRGIGNAQLATHFRYRRTQFGLFEGRRDPHFGIAGLFHRHHLRQRDGFIMPYFQFWVEQKMGVGSAQPGKG